MEEREINGIWKRQVERAKLYHEPMRIWGKYESIAFRLISEDGRLFKQFKKGTRRHIPNLIVDAGINSIWRTGIGNTLAARPAQIGWIAQGTGSVAPVAGDTALGTETERGAATYSEPATKQFREQATITVSVARAITEAGTFNASAAGTMFSRVTFTVVNLAVNDGIDHRFTYTGG